jgi:ArsR family transcriptional regulator
MDNTHDSVRESNLSKPTSAGASVPVVGNMTGQGEKPATLDADGAITVMSGLGHKQRIEIWRTLVPVGTRGLSAGSLSVQLDIAPSSLSFHLQRMSRAGILMQRNHKRSIIYSANSDIIDALCLFLSVIAAPRVNELSAATEDVWKAAGCRVAKDDGATAITAESAMGSILPHPGMLPSGSSIALPECSRPDVSLSIDCTGSALPPVAA